MLCLHCNLFSASRPRGLCWSCFYTAGIRERYPPRGKRIGGGAGMKRRPAASPTVAMPGSPEKIRVLMKRVDNGEELFHPDDRDFYSAPLELAELVA